MPFGYDLGWVKGSMFFDGGLWVHIGAIWRIRLNRPCAAAMRHFCHITWTACLTSILLLTPQMSSEIYGGDGGGRGRLGVVVARKTDLNWKL